MELLYNMRSTSCNVLVRRVHGQPVDNYCPKHLSFVVKFTTCDATTEVMEFNFLEAYINFMRNAN